jgi:hypothetical protein
MHEEMGAYKGQLLSQFRHQEVPEAMQIFKQGPILIVWPSLKQECLSGLLIIWFED